MKAVSYAQDLERNLRLFVWFRVLFNARFYYPVFAVFFTDMGLSIAQFFWLNVIWALTIAIFEVPSGVLADIIGRRKLVIFAALSMALEMLLLILAPQNAGWGLFGLCAINRVLSGLAEAASSGADEALAYDSLKQIEHDQSSITQRWDDTLVSAMRWRSLGMVIAMLIGALSYDHERMQMIFGGFPPILSLKAPIILCFISALICVWISFRLREPDGASSEKADNLSSRITTKATIKPPSIKTIFIDMKQAFSWILSTRWLVIIILAALLIDSTTRTFATVISEYLRWLGLPEYAFGIIGAAVSLCGWLVPLYARPLAKAFSPNANILIAGGVALSGSLGLSLLNGPIAIIAVIFTTMSLIHTGFLLSRYLNAEAPSKQRASILSIKSLFLNVAYGSFSAIFALRLQTTDFGNALTMIPITLAVGLLLWLLMTRISSSRAQKPQCDE